MIHNIDLRNQTEMLLEKQKIPSNRLHFTLEFILPPCDDDVMMTSLLDLCQISSFFPFPLFTVRYILYVYSFSFAPIPR